MIASSSCGPYLILLVLVLIDVVVVVPPPQIVSLAHVHLWRSNFLRRSASQVFCWWMVAPVTGECFNLQHTSITNKRDIAVKNVTPYFTLLHHPTAVYHLPNFTPPPLSQPPAPWVLHVTARGFETTGRLDTAILHNQKETKRNYEGWKILIFVLTWTALI